MPDPTRALASLRHLYAQMLDGRVTDTAEAARGLLGPAIASLEATASPSSAGVRDLAGLIEALVTATKAHEAAVVLGDTLEVIYRDGECDAARQTLDDAIAGLVPASVDEDRRAVMLHVIEGESNAGMVVLQHHDCLGTYAVPVLLEGTRFVDILADAEIGATVDEHDRVRIRLDERNIATIAAMISLTPPVATGPRVPSPEWRPRQADYSWELQAGHLRAIAHRDPFDRGGFEWRVSAPLGGVEHVLTSPDDAPPCDSLIAAQLAAESALAAIATAALRAIGR